jgi:hypothetical protein
VETSPKPRTSIGEWRGDWGSPKPRTGSGEWQETGRGLPQATHRLGGVAGEGIGLLASQESRTGSGGLQGTGRRCDGCQASAIVRMIVRMIDRILERKILAT